MVNNSEQTIQRHGPRVESSSTSSPDYSKIVAGICRNDSASFEQLDRVFRRGVEFFFSRSGASALSLDKLADECFARVRAQIALGALMIPAELPRLVRKTLADMIPRSQFLPEDCERTELGSRVLAQMSKRGVESIRAYFVDGETPAAICFRLKISEQTFEQYKAEANSLFRAAPAQLSQRRLRIG